MPTVACEFARLGKRINLLCLTSLLLNTGDDTDRVSELAVGFGYGMNMEARSFRLQSLSR